MTLREMNLAVFQGKPLPHVFFQPRFEPWVAWHRQFNSLPAEIRDLSLLETYDRIGASMRNVHYYTGQPDPVIWYWAPEVRITQEEKDGVMKIRYDTPHGPLFETCKWTVDLCWRMVEHKAKTADDLPALKWLVQRRRSCFSIDNYRVGEAYVGDRGKGQFWVARSPYMTLAHDHFAYSDFIYTLTDDREAVEDIFKIIDESYDPLFDQLAACPDLKMLNFGENIAEAFLSPQYYEQYLLPWYQKRSGQLRRAGIYTYIHIDGYFRSLLPYLADMPFDGLEALTPKPQGDVTLEEIREHIGDKILLDGIPAVLFLDHHSREELRACVERIVKLFHPRLVLGVSDELPQGGGDEAFERLKMVGNYCRTGRWA